MSREAVAPSEGWPRVQNLQECWGDLGRSQRGVRVQNTVCLMDYYKTVHFVIKKEAI